MPADQETIRYTGRVRRRPRRQAVPDARGARRRLGRPLLRRRRGHDPRRARTRATCRPSSARGASRSSSSGSGWPSTPAAPGGTAAAAATRSTSGCSRTRTSCRSPTGRSWRAGASRAARPAGRSRSRSTSADPTSASSTRWPTPSRSPAGQVIRIRTTGGGGWGDPLDRPYDDVVRDVAWGKVSVEGAAADYGVVARRDGDDVVLDESRLRRAAGRAARRPGRPMATSCRSSTADPGTPGCPAVRRTPTSTCWGDPLSVSCSRFHQLTTATRDV